MTPESQDRGAKRRELMRELVGRPGSLVRWLVFTGAWLVVCLLVATQVDRLLKIVVLVFAVLIPFAAFRARALLVGDEDEVRATVKQLTSKEARSIPFEDDSEVRLSPEAWLSRSGKDFNDAPPPPSRESVEIESLPTQDCKR